MNQKCSMFGSTHQLDTLQSQLPILMTGVSGGLKATKTWSIINLWEKTTCHSIPSFSPRSYLVQESPGNWLVNYRIHILFCLIIGSCSHKILV